MPSMLPTSSLLRLHTFRHTTAALLRTLIQPQRRRPFSATCVLLAKQLPPRRQILDAEIEENFLKGSGPGGQKINKTSSAVQLKHLPTGIVVKCQETRSRTQNRKLARQILSERIEEAELGDGSRIAIKARAKSKKKASADKKKRRKYRALAEGKEDEGLDEEAADESEEIEEGVNSHDAENVEERDGRMQEKPR